MPRVVAVVEDKSIDVGRRRTTGGIWKNANFAAIHVVYRAFCPALLTASLTEKWSMRLKVADDGEIKYYSFVKGCLSKESYVYGCQI